LEGVVVVLSPIRGPGKDDYIDDGINDGLSDDGIDDDVIDGQGELRSEMLWVRNWRKVEYPGAKMIISMMVSMMASMMMVSMMMVSMMMVSAESDVREVAVCGLA
jgi:hypothetical protein